MITHRTGNKTWTNRHETFTKPISDLYDLGNDDTGNVLNDYNASTTGIQGIIRDAINNNMRLRALGGEWSWTEIALTDGIMLNTKALNLTFNITPGSVSPNYVQTPSDLYFAQCGVSIQELSDALRRKNRSIKTSGASNGQTIAGALSTGTHGSAIDFGSIPDFVVGLHIIISPTRHVWLERNSYPVVSDSFVAKLNAELVRNDEWFNAALVSFGSFGFIHGVMIETEPLFLYECHRIRLPLNPVLFHMMETLDFTNAPLPQGSERPYHFQVLINQYDLNNGAYCTVMYKRPHQAGYTPPGTSSPDIVPGDDAPAFIGIALQAVPALTPAVVNPLIAKSYKPYANVWGTHAEIFTNTDTHGKVLSAAIGVPLGEVLRVKDLLLSLNNSHGPFAGVFAFRFVKGTKATLGFTYFDPTCVIELDGVFSDRTYAFYHALWSALDAQNIPHTFHWGKILELDAVRLRKLYGDTRVDSWITSRAGLMNDIPSMNVFTNNLMTQWGLTTIPQTTPTVEPVT